MKIRIVGGGWYGCHLAVTLLGDGHEVEVHEKSSYLFAGASAANPARLHLGFHYPRSKATRAASQANYRRFMDAYGDLTRGVPVNIYAVARDTSLVDFGNYTDTLRGEADFVVVERPEEFGLANVEGAVLTGERHILVNGVREHFREALDGRVRFGVEPDDIDDAEWDLTVDCTFSSLSREGVERYEPCLTHIYEGRWDKAVTVMDGPFPSFYPHYGEDTVSLTSAVFTPLARCKTTEEAHAILDDMSVSDIARNRGDMADLMSTYYPAFPDEYRYVDTSRAVRAMPLSGADGRLFELAVGARSIRLRAGKIDAIFSAADRVREIVGQWERSP